MVLKIVEKEAPLNLSPEKIARRKAFEMTLRPEPKKIRIKKFILRRDVKEDLEMEKSLKSSSKIEMPVRPIRTTSKMASGASDFDAPSITLASGEEYKGDNLKKFLSEL
ncbi:MAG: hypothetical protein AAB632_03095 [Patescibacteria group bacterium]